MLKRSLGSILKSIWGRTRRQYTKSQAAKRMYTRSDKVVS